MIPPELDFVGIISCEYADGTLWLRFRLSDGRECSSYWTTGDMRQFMTAYTRDDAEPREAPRDATLQ